MEILEEVIPAQQWIPVCNAEDIPENGGACVKVEDQQIAVFNFKRRKQWYATQNLCPHKRQMVLSRGMIGSTGENCEPKVACPFHKNTFSLITGKGISDEELYIKTYPVKVYSGLVYICLEQ